MYALTNCNVLAKKQKKMENTTAKQFRKLIKNCTVETSNELCVVSRFWYFCRNVHFMISYKIQSTNRSNMRIELSFQGFSNFRDPHKIKTLNSGFEIPPKSSLCVHLPVLLIGSGKPTYFGMVSHSHSVQCAVRTAHCHCAPRAATAI